MYVNGHAGAPTGPAASTPPAGPSALKGKQVEVGWTQPGVSSGVGALLPGCSKKCKLMDILHVHRHNQTAQDPAGLHFHRSLRR